MLVLNVMVQTSGRGPNQLKKVPRGLLTFDNQTRQFRILRDLPRGLYYLENHVYALLEGLVVRSLMFVEGLFTARASNSVEGCP